MSVFFIILEISGNDERRFWKIAKMEATRNSKRQGTILTTTTMIETMTLGGGVNDSVMTL